MFILFRRLAQSGGLRQVIAYCRFLVPLKNWKERERWLHYVQSIGLFNSVNSLSELLEHSQLQQTVFLDAGVLKLFAELFSELFAAIF